MPRILDLDDALPGSALADALGERPRLLIVDDQPANIQALYQTFAADHQVYMATDGPQALQVAAAKQPDLVLLDVVMPGMDGYEVCASLKADDTTRHIPIVFVTARNDDDDEARGLDLGAVDFISKPINPKIVRARVRTHVTLKRQADLLRRWVYIDGLTGVANRRYFDEQLAAEWRRSHREGDALTLAMIDVDHFKRYNDRHGHQAGDDCLRQIAAALKTVGRRPGDLLARFGGEEFAFILPHTDAAGARHVARLLAQAADQAALPHLNSPVAGHVTVSIGLCTQPPGLPCTLEQLVREADTALYQAKAAGRHRACLRTLPVVPAEPVQSLLI